MAFSRVIPPPSSGASKSSSRHRGCRRTLGGPMPAADVDLTLMIREGQNSVGAERPPHRPRPGNPVVRGLEIILTRSGCRPPRRIGGCRPLRREGPKSPPRNRGVPTHSIGRAPKLCHRDRGADPLHREGPEITSPRSGGADPLVGRARNHLTEIGECRPPRREGPKITSPKSGDADCPPSALVGQIRQIEEGSVSGSS
jgi:hypothetical protein